MGLGISDIIKWARRKVDFGANNEDRSTWPNPTASIGDVVDYIRDKDNKIRCTCWEAVGPARERWKVLGPQIRNYVTDHDDGMEDGFAGDLVIAFYMVGRSEDTAAPMVVFRSSVPTSRNGARDVVRASRIMESHPGIGLGVMPGRTIHRMASEDVETTLSSSSEYRGPQRLVSSPASDEAFGRRLWIEGCDSNHRRPATGALIIWIGDRVVQLTAGHAFQENKSRPPLGLYEPLTVENVEFDGMSDLENDEHEGSQSTCELQQKEDPPSTGHMRRWWRDLGEITFSTNGNTPPSKPPSIGRDVAGVGGMPATRNRSNMYHRDDIVQVGRLFDLPDTGDLDYALVELDGGFRSGMNRMKSGKDVDHRWLSVRAVREIHVRKEDTFVSIATFTSSSGYISGNLSATPIYLRIAGTSRLQEVFPVELEGTIAQGDCGSPIVDRIYGHFYGHIVAGTIGTGFAYMVPGTKVMEDIETRQQKKAYLAPPIPIIHGELEQRLIESEIGLCSPQILPRYGPNDAFQFIDFASKEFFKQHLTPESTSSGYFQGLDMMSRYMKISNSTPHAAINPGSSSQPPTMRSSSSPAHVEKKTIVIHNHEEPVKELPQSVTQHALVPLSELSDLPAQPSETMSIFERGFFAKMPFEIQIEILSWLGVPDLLHLRLASRAWNSFITCQDVEISFAYLRRPHTPSLLIKLFPPPDSSPVNLGYISSLWHRYSVACRLSSSISEWITRDQFLRRTPAKRRDFLECEVRMRRRLVPILLIAEHYFETYRQELLLLSEQHVETADERMELDHTAIERRIMDQYDDITLLQAHQFFPVLLAFQGRRLRPASYLGHVERPLRGYFSDPLAGDVQLAMLYLGGLREVFRLTRMDASYEKLRFEADEWFSDVTKEENSSGPRVRPITRQLRKVLRSNPILRTHLPSGSTTSTKAEQSLRGQGASGKSKEVSVKPTSLADKGWQPMGPIAPDEVRFVLARLPTKKSQVWMPTAEEILLDRGVIARPQDIKKSAAVLQELISPQAPQLDVLFYERGLEGCLDFDATV